MMMNTGTVYAGCLLMGLSKIANSFEMIIIGRLVFGMSAGKRFPPFIFLHLLIPVHALVV